MRFLLFLIFFVLAGCQHEEIAYTSIPTPIALNEPAHFPAAVYNSAKNPLTAAGIALGKKLFYDGNLSSDGVVSCGFCHLQSHAFTHHGHNLSHGVYDRVGRRNTPAIQNVAFQESFMWDGAATFLDHVAIIPLTSEVEMDQSLQQILDYLKQDKTYAKMFSQAFGASNITVGNFLNALAQFMLTFDSSHSKYDQVMQDPSKSFTDLEATGYDLFNSKCSSCHATALFTDGSYRNTGLTMHPYLMDLGRYETTLLDADRNKFKVPSLRNVELTAPYMHDGRFLSLEAVLNHYTDGVVSYPNLDPILQRGISLTAGDKVAIIAFLKTLTDHQFISNSKLSEY